MGDTDSVDVFTRGLFHNNIPGTVSSTPVRADVELKHRIPGYLLRQTPCIPSPRVLDDKAPRTEDQAARAFDIDAFWPVGTASTRILPLLEFDVAFEAEAFTRTTKLDRACTVASMDKDSSAISESDRKLAMAPAQVERVRFRTDTNDHVMLLHGHTQGAMLFHCGAIVYLAETGQLGRYAVIWAENMSIPLAHLVSFMWHGLVNGNATTINHLTRFAVMFASVSCARWPNVLVSVLETLQSQHTEAIDSKAARPLIYTSLDDPDVTRANRPGSSMCSPRYWQGRPFDDVMKEAVGMAAPVTDRLGHSDVAGTWAAIIAHLPQLVADTHATVLNIHVLYAGCQSPPPHRIGHLPCIDPAEIATLFGFVSALWIIAQTVPIPPQKPIPRVYLRTFSVYHGDTHAIKYKRGARGAPMHWPTQLKARVCHFMRMHKSVPVVEHSTLVALLNWGFLATWSTTRRTDASASQLHPCFRRTLIAINPESSWDDKQLCLSGWKREAVRAALAQGSTRRSLCGMCSTHIESSE